MKQINFVIYAVLMTIVLGACGGGGGDSDGPVIVGSSNDGEVFTATAVLGDQCIGGMAGEFSCLNIDLMSILEFDVQTSDLWGWTDSIDGTEYALVGVQSGTVFVNLSNPEQPFVAGFLPSASSESSWRDIKVNSDHAYIVSEAADHGLQIFDLTRLRGVSEAVQFSEDAHYGEFGGAHNIAINEASGYAYVVGSDSCQGGLHMIDISTPQQAQFAGCYSDKGFTHDSQCVVYQGADSNYLGREICFNANEDRMVIVDVSDKATPVLVSEVSYSAFGYIHQAWLTEDHAFLLMNDETDELDYGHNTRTYIWDLSDLSAPFLKEPYTAATGAIDHNLYVRGNHVFQANYTAGVRVLESGDLSQSDLTEVAFFDSYPASDAAIFSGAWSVYPYFESGVVIASSIETGLFVLRPNLN